MGPKVVTQIDAEEILRAKEKAQAENEEKAGDDDEAGIENSKDNGEGDAGEDEEE